jgi:hypothetical protein
MSKHSGRPLGIDIDPIAVDGGNRFRSISAAVWRAVRTGQSAAKSCRNHNDLLEARGGADARHYRRDANTSIC